MKNNCLYIILTRPDKIYNLLYFANVKPIPSPSLVREGNEPACLPQVGRFRPLGGRLNACEGTVSTDGRPDRVLRNRIIKNICRVKYIILFALVGFIQPSSFAQVSQEANQIENSNWPDQRPITLIPKRKVWSLLGAKKMGASRNMEWQIRPLFFFVSPHLGLKKYWKENKNGWHIASFHQINYPSIFLNLIAREGAGGVLPEDSQIPPMLSLKNEILLGLNRDGNFFTLRGGLVTAFKLGSAEKNFPDIDFPFFYHRTLAFNHSPNIYLGINYNRDLNLKWNLEADFAAYLVDFKSNDVVFENRIVALWKKSDRFALKLGAAAAYGAYPYGFDFRAIPVFDLLFGFGNK